MRHYGRRMVDLSYTKAMMVFATIALFNMVLSGFHLYELGYEQGVEDACTARE